MVGELEEVKEGKAGSDAEVQQLHKQLLRLEENAEADLARAAEEVTVSWLANPWLIFIADARLIHGWLMAALLYAHLVIASRGWHVFSADQFSRFNWKKHVAGHRIVRVCMQAEFRHMHGDCA